MEPEKALEEDEGQRKIVRFPLERIQPNRVILMVARKGSGKSTALRHLLLSLRHKIDMAVAMTPTYDTIKELQTMMPIACIHNNFNEEVVSAIVAHQQERDQGELHKYTVAIILDDCMFDPKVLKSQAIANLHMNGRHLNILFINLVQYVMDYPARLRNSVDYVFAWWEGNREIRFKLWKTFFGIFERFEDFDETMKALTGDRRCMVLDNTLNSSDIEKSIYHFKANQHLPEFMIGCRGYWKLHYKTLEDEAERRRKRQEKAERLKNHDAEAPIPPLGSRPSLVAKRPSRSLAKAPPITTQIVFADEASDSATGF